VPVLSRFISAFWLTLALVPVLHAQNWVMVSDGPTHTDYELRNDSLRIGAWFEVTVPATAERRWQILEQDVRPISDARFFHEEMVATGLDLPLADASNPGVYRGMDVASLRIHTARRTNRPDVYLVTRHARVRVFKPEVPRSRRLAVQNTPGPLSSGTWYRIPITRNGIHILDRAYLTALGINMATVNLNQIQMWATDGYEMPRRNNLPKSEFRQVPIRVDGDNILFFANGPHRVRFDVNSRRHSHHLHPYTNTRYVFLTVGSAPGLRLTPQTTSSEPTAILTTFTDFRWKEEELRKPDQRIKSGHQWLGQPFTPETFARTQVVYRDTLDGFASGSTVRMELQFAARASIGSRFDVTMGSTSVGNVFVAAISDLNESTARSVNLGVLTREVVVGGLSNDVLEISATYNNSNPNALGWLDFVRISAERDLQARNGVLAFFSPNSGSGRTVRYRLSGFATAPMVVDATDPHAPVWLEATAEAGAHAVVHSDQAGRFLYAQTRFFRPGPGTLVPNQNLKVANDPDYFIVTVPELLDVANQLASRRAGQGWRPIVATQTQIFNEFNGGTPDATAIREFVRHYYIRTLGDPDRMPKALLLFGDATFDFKGILTNQPLNNLVFTFQSDESYGRISTFASDDYFGFLDDIEGEWAPLTTFERLDIGVGRIPVQTAAQARVFLRKIEAYENPSNFGDWRTLVTFSSDDHVNGGRQENDLHVFNADYTADFVPRELSGLRVNKVHQISYPLSPNTLGRAAVEANRAFVNALNNGTLVMNYAGHGSETLLSAEGLYRADDVSRLTNLDRLTILTTVTCEFGRYDDTELQSGAEIMMLHPTGGAIASYTTSRVVYTSSDPTQVNFGLNIQLTIAKLTPDLDGRPKTLGEIYRETKNTTVGASFNSRKFHLLGDPAMRIGLPEHRIRLTRINEQPLDARIRLRALDRVEVGGEVVDAGGSVKTAFTGETSIRVFDATRYIRMTVLNTCNNMPNCLYALQNDVIFSGRATVDAGRFTTQFIIPRDIAYSDTTGRITAYAFNEQADASGSFADIVFNGRNESAVDDRSGPSLTAFLNDTDFMDGGVVNEQPVLIVNLEDQSGINTAGSSVGHELLAVLRRSDAIAPERTFLMNEYYESAVNDFTRGSVRFPLQDLDDGTYELTVRAWDVFNNPGETQIRFQVVSGAALEVRNVYNYPNPMSGHTRFLFEHNRSGGDLDVLIRIFTLSGRPVAQLRERNLTPSGMLAGIDWDGRDADGNRLASGTYLYHVRIRSGDATHETVEKLSIIR
jgi:hypothetical protein